MGIRGWECLSKKVRDGLCPNQAQGKMQMTKSLTVALKAKNCRGLVHRFEAEADHKERLKKTTEGLTGGSERTQTLLRTLRPRESVRKHWPETAKGGTRD